MTKFKIRSDFDFNKFANVVSFFLFFLYFECIHLICTLWKFNLKSFYSSNKCSSICNCDNERLTFLSSFWIIKTNALFGNFFCAFFQIFWVNWNIFLLKIKFRWCQWKWQSLQFTHVDTAKFAHSEKWYRFMGNR